MSEHESCDMCKGCRDAFKKVDRNESKLIQVIEDLRESKDDYKERLLKIEFKLEKAEDKRESHAKKMEKLDEDLTKHTKEENGS